MIDLEQSEQTRRLVEVTALIGYLKGIEMLETYREKSRDNNAWRLHSDDSTEVCNITDRLEALAYPLRKAQQKFKVEK